MAHTPVSKGNQAEDQALEFLIQKGLRLVARNFKIRTGEIDLIMEDCTGKESTEKESAAKDSVLVFVEVRYRKSNHYGSPAESITASKISKIARTAEYYLLQNPRFRNKTCRFDVVAITGKQSPEWIENAFTLE